MNPGPNGEKVEFGPVNIKLLFQVSSNMVHVSQHLDMKLFHIIQSEEEAQLYVLIKADKTKLGLKYASYYFRAHHMTWLASHRPYHVRYTLQVALSA